MKIKIKKIKYQGITTKRVYQEFYIIFENSKLATKFFKELNKKFLMVRKNNYVFFTIFKSFDISTRDSDVINKFQQDLDFIFTISKKIDLVRSIYSINTKQLQ